MEIDSIAFPLRVCRDSGGLHTVSGAESIRQSVWLILQTRRGERPMAPTFGSDLYRYAFEPMSSATQELIAREVTATLTRWEDRIENITVTFPPTAAQDGTLYCTVHYDIIGANNGEQVDIPLQTP